MLFFLMCIVRIKANSQLIGIEGFLAHKMTLNMHSKPQQLFILGICPSIQLKSKFMSYFLELERLKR